MATYTDNLNLKKPNAEDFYNVADFNGNADILDTEVAKKANKVVGGTEGNFVALDANGDIVDSGNSASDFDVATHTGTNITSANGVHGIRYNDNKLQYYDNDTWNDAKTATHLYLSDWEIYYYSPSGGSRYYYAHFRMLTSYNPTATNLTTFKQMMGTNVGNITNMIIPYFKYNVTYEMYLLSASISNNVFSGSVSDGTSSYQISEGTNITLTITRKSNYQIF